MSTLATIVVIVACIGAIASWIVGALNFALTLRVLHDPTAGSELVRVLGGARWRIGPADLAALSGLARWLAERAVTGEPIAFCIGGPDGLAPAVDAGACLRWSLSALTLPHGLARVVAAEALYRAVSVIKGQPYHRA